MRLSRPWQGALLCAATLLAHPVLGSVGDRLPEFRECVEVCIEEPGRRAEGKGEEGEGCGPAWVTGGA